MPKCHPIDSSLLLENQVAGLAKRSLTAYLRGKRGVGSADIMTLSSSELPIPKKYRKHCPICKSTKLDINPFYGFTCKTYKPFNTPETNNKRGENE
jgi:hypothetical protein